MRSICSVSRAAPTRRARWPACSVPASIPRHQRDGGRWNLYQQMAKFKDQRGHYGPNSKKRAPYDTEINDLQDKLDKMTRYKGKDLPMVRRRVGYGWPTASPPALPTASFPASSPTGRGASATRVSAPRWTLGCMPLPSMRCASRSCRHSGRCALIATSAIRRSSRCGSLACTPTSVAATTPPACPMWRWPG